MSSPKSNKRTTYPKDTESKLRDKIRKLQARNSKLTKENRHLKSELRDLTKNFDRQIKQIKELSEVLTVEEMIEIGKRVLEEEKREREAAKEKDREEVRKKFAKLYGNGNAKKD